MNRTAATRRTTLKYLGSCLSLGSLSFAASEASTSDTSQSTPDCLSIANIHNEVIRLAQSLVQNSNISQSTHSVVSTFLRQPGSSISVRRLEHHIRRDIVDGRTAILDGWVISETELVLLASVNSL